jgi:hypothetical protein
MRLERKRLDVALLEEKRLERGKDEDAGTGCASASGSSETASGRRELRERKRSKDVAGGRQDVPMHVLFGSSGQSNLNHGRDSRKVHTTRCNV